MASQRPSVSVCFPAYNEETTIETVVSEASRLLEDAGLDYEILVCDDGSQDSTRQRIDALAARLPRVRCVHNATNRGIRETFEHLYREASKEFVFLNSTDGQWPTAVLFELLPLTSEYDVVIASRISKHYTVGRRLVSWLFNALPVVLFGVRTYDAGAVKLTRRKIIESLPIVSKSPFSEAERLIRAARAGFRITAVATATSARKAGKASGVRARLLVQAAVDVARVWWELGRNRHGGR